MTALDFRCGRWQDCLADVDQVDALIVDASYSAKVHQGNDDLKIRDGLGYEPMRPRDIRAYCQHWAPRTRGWVVSITSHDLWPWWRRGLEAEGRYVFAPIPLVDRGMTVRLQGDGPSSWTVWLCCARPRTKQMAWWGTLPGAYTREHGDPRSPRRGGKPLGVMREIVKDYTRRGDLVLDTHAGEATTLLASIHEGRLALGAEKDPGAHQAGLTRCGPQARRAAVVTL